MLASLSARELVEWRLLEAIEPFGERRADWRAAVTTAMLMKVQGSKVSVGDVWDALTDVFEQDVPTIDDDEARQVRMESAVMAYAGRFKSKGT